MKKINKRWETSFPIGPRRKYDSISQMCDRHEHNKFRSCFDETDETVRRNGGVINSGSDRGIAKPSSNSSPFT